MRRLPWCDAPLRGVLRPCRHSARADDAKVTEILDKAIKALGGKEKLAKAEAVTWKAKGKITIEGNENEISSERHRAGHRSLPLGVRGRLQRQQVQGLSRSSTATRAGGSSAT